MITFPQAALLFEEYDAPRLTPPCGPCRQILWEFCGNIWVRMVDLKGRSRTLRLSELLPLPFDQRNL